MTITGTGTVPTVTITRVNDLNGDLRDDPDQLSDGASGKFTFNKPLGDAYAQFYIDVAWKAVPGGEVTTERRPSTAGSGNPDGPELDSVPADGVRRPSPGPQRGPGR